jgi:hypothetical protein
MRKSGDFKCDLSNLKIHIPEKVKFGVGENECSVYQIVLMIVRNLLD